MRYIRRSEQDRLTEERSHWRRPATREPSDAYFDGEPLPPDVAPRHWLLEGEVHQVRRLGRTDDTRYFIGPQVTVLRDDMRRLTWAAIEEQGRIVLAEYAQPAVSEAELGRQTVARGNIWRYHITLNKYDGAIVTTWISRENGSGELWHDGARVATAARNVDFPFFALSQVPIGLIQSEEPPYGVLGYKSRDTGELFIRRVEGKDLGPEQVVTDLETVGGVSFGVIGDDVLARVDLLRDGQVVPALLESSDGARSFSKPRPIDLSEVDKPFSVRPGFASPIVDKGGALQVPIGLESDSEALALNHVVASDLLVEAIRVEGRLRKEELWVFPSTLGSGNTFGNGVSDGHGLIMGLSTENGHLFTSNSSAGGSHFPHSHLMNHEFPLIADFSGSECYSSGLTPNVVSMDYLFVESNDIGRPVSSDVYIETWDMPLPEPKARATAKGGKVRVEILNDADLEPGKVTFGFDDASVAITDVEIHDLRSATVTTSAKDLAGKTITFDVLTLFHRHYGEARIEEGVAAG